MTLESDKLWPTVLPRMQAALNNSTKYLSTVKSSNEVLFGFKTKEALDFLRAEDYTQEDNDELGEDGYEDEPNTVQEHALVSDIVENACQACRVAPGRVLSGPGR